TTATLYSGRTSRASSLWSRLRPTSVAPANSNPMGASVADRAAWTAAFRKRLPHCAKRLRFLTFSYSRRESGGQAGKQRGPPPSACFADGAEGDPAPRLRRRGRRGARQSRAPQARARPRDCPPVSSPHPRSVEEAKEIARDVPDALRDKARERLGRLPEP